jgi:sulfatase maturation enzyme AslB (radical SAM superfamily)
MLKYKKIFLGNSCNNRCLHCSYRQKDPSSTDINTILHSLNQKKEENVLFYGGEPALRNDLFQIINAAKENGYRRIKLLTNGRAFSDINFLYQTINAGCYLFEIKLWGSNPSLHDYLTQSPNSFEETISGLENLANLPYDKFVCVRIPVCKENYADVENTVATALNFGVNRIILSMQDHQLVFHTVLPHIKNAINISIFNRIWVLTEGLPFCIMQGLEQHMNEIYQGWDSLYEKTFKQHGHCFECVHKEICPGVESGYPEKHGDKEFSPVPANKYSRDIKALYE